MVLNPKDGNDRIVCEKHGTVIFVKTEIAIYEREDAGVNKFSEN